MMKKCAILLLSVTSLLCINAFCQETEELQAGEEQKVISPITDPELSTFTSLVKTAGLWDFFQGTGPFTVFAPSNTAFAKLDITMLANLQEPKNRDHLIDLVNYHIILGKYLSGNLKSKQCRTVNGKEITIRVENGDIFVNNAKIMRRDLVGPNGVVHVIDTVLIP